MILVSGSTCALRPWKLSDAESLVRHGNNRKVWRNLSDVFPHPCTAEDANEWLGMREADEPPIHSYAIIVEGEAVGSVGFDIMPLNYSVTARVGYWLGEAFWGRGIATEACGMLCEHIFNNFPDIQRLEAIVYEWNPASMRVLEKCGFVQEAIMKRAANKDGQIIDVHLFARYR
ncbi:MAG TPA: GNAT family N-acetyltransferase [Candidatus Hydrogenedentes bacterium]|nr:GNAT family N-acetyltransferase [Candidatus Hydrogenedentota bacterium]HRK34366.1 GNAT family N-acetyltransferase [Candidatus Hydrogenedentota bacterium]